MWLTVEESDICVRYALLFNTYEINMIMLFYVLFVLFYVLIVLF